MSFDQALVRVLDPAGLYWRYPDDKTDDPSIIRTIEVRLDVPSGAVLNARQHMEAAGWTCASQPDDPQGDSQRIYFRRKQSLLDDERKEMLTTALRAACENGGRFWSWLDRPEEPQN